MIDIEAKLSSELGVEKWQVTAAVQLIDEDNTIPFIARYRKEKTGALNDEVLRKLYERLIYLRNLEDKKQQVIATIQEKTGLGRKASCLVIAAIGIVVSTRKEISASRQVK